MTQTQTTLAELLQLIGEQTVELRVLRARVVELEAAAAEKKKGDEGVVSVDLS